MSITVRFFAGLRKRIGRDQGKIDIEGIRCAADVRNRVAWSPA